MNKVHPVKKSSRKKKSSYRNRTARTTPDSDDDDTTSSLVEPLAPTTGNGGITVLTNQSTRIVDVEDEVISQVLAQQNPVYKEEHEEEEERLMSRVNESGINELHEAYARRVEDEEARLREGFVDKNVVDREFDNAMKREEEVLQELRDRSSQTSVLNETSIDEEEYRLKRILESKQEDVYVDDEDQRLQELLRIKSKTVDMNIQDVDTELEFPGENVRLNRAHIVQSTMEGETAHESQMRTILEKQDSTKRLESHLHRVNRDVEDAKLRDQFAKRATFQKRESEMLLKQNTRKNLAVVNDPKKAKKGKVQYRTAGGRLKFNMHESGAFSAAKNVHMASSDFDFIQQINRHVQFNDCRYEKDPGRWMLNKDSDFLNDRPTIYDFESFNDATGEKIHNANSDCLVVNTAREYLIPTTASIGQQVKRHVNSKDANIENIKVHDLRLTSTYLNHVRGHDLCTEGVFVQRAHTMHLPLPHTTELRNACTYFIPAENSLVNRDKRLITFDDCVIGQKAMRWDLCEGGDIVQKKLSHSLALTGSQDEQVRVYFVPDTGSQDENNPLYLIPDSVLINKVRSSSVPTPGPGDVRNITRHRHHGYETYSCWKPSHFDIRSDGKLEHEIRFGNFGDANWTPCDNKYAIPDGLSIDEDYLNESDGEEEV